MEHLNFFNTKNFRFFLFAVSLYAIVLSGCTTLQQDISVDKSSYSEEVMSYENRLARFDADSLMSAGGTVDTAAIEKFIAEISVYANDPSVQRASLARLLALEGRAYLLLGKNSKAETLYQESVAAYKGDAHSIILARRLGLQSDDVTGDNALLTLDSAVDLYKTKKYLESVAKFDEAFLALDSFYKSSYVEVRDSAWGLRNLSESQASGDLLILKKISVLQMLAITRSTTDLLYNYTSGKPLSDKELFAKLVAVGLLNPVSQPPSSENAVVENDIVTKYISARFLWNLYNSKKKSSATINKYSTRFRSQNRKSPVKDLDVASDDFDAVLGCVENEFMSLEDGVNFNGEKPVSALEFSEYINHIK